jgi:phosphate-selective porin OprO/OprP
MLNTLVIITVLAAATQTHPKENTPDPTDANKGVSAEFEPGKGLDMSSSDGDFRLVTNLAGQVLYTVVSDEEEETSQSLQIRRARLVFSGHWFGEHNKYYIQFALSPRDLQFKDGNPTKSPVFDWILTFDYLRDFSFRLGQYRVPFSRQRRIPYSKLQLVDRALANFEFNLDRDIGMDFHSNNLLGLDLFRYNAGVFIGEGRDTYEQSDFELLYVARVEVLPLGMFEDYFEADLERRSKPALSIGAAYAFLDKAKGNRGILGSAPSDGGTTDTHNATADLMFKLVGFSLLSEVYYRKGKRDFGDATVIGESGVEVAAPLEDARTGMGWFAQVGWVVPKVPFELAGRYSQVRPVGDHTSLTRSDEVGGGLNWYFFGPSLKLSADYFHTFKEGDLDNATDQLRVQLQAGF